MTGLVVDIVDLPRSSGAAKTVHREAPAPAGLGTPVIGVPEGSPILLDATLISMENGVLVRAGARVHVHGECVRCLRDLDEERTVDFDELYLLPEAAAAQLEEGDEEAADLFLVGETDLDLEPALRDALILGLPQRPLCRPDCRGLCPGCGERMEDLPEGHAHEVVDPRWSALAGMFDGDAGDGDEAPDDAGGGSTGLADDAGGAAASTTSSSGLPTLSEDDPFAGYTSSR